MTHSFRRGTPPPRRLRSSAAMIAAAAVVGALLLPTAAHAAPESGFASSFESDDATPVLTGTGQPDNFAGGSFAPGSALPFLKDVTASAENAPGETAANAADGNASSKWLAFKSSGWLQYEFTEPQAIAAYTLTSGNDADERDPRDFRVLGSNDGEDWTPIDEQSGQDPIDGRGETVMHRLDGKSEAYAFYRLDITAVQSGNVLQLAGFEPITDPDAEPAASDMTLEVDSGPTSSSTAKTGVGFSGTQALKYSGAHIADGSASSSAVVYDDLDIAVDDDSELSYTLFPTLDGGQSYASTFAAVDLVFDDGSVLSDSDATDQYGYGVSASEQGSSKKLWPDQWNRVAVDLSEFSGRTITEIRLDYDRPADAVAGIENAAGGTRIAGWLDDVEIGAAEQRDTSDGLVSYVDTTRATNSSGGFSRGNNFPATAVPNGFNFLTPMTNANSFGTLYEYQAANNSDNRPALQAIGFSHEPSIWMGDRNQLAVLPQAGAEPTSTLKDRQLAFGHDSETARPDIYSVAFDNGIDAAVTPTDHGAIYRFGFEGDANSVIVDRGAGSSKLTIDADGTVSGWVEGGSGWPGKTRMFVYGAFDEKPLAAGQTPNGDRSESARYAAFDTSDDADVELRIASSFISLDQAEANFGLELDGVSFDDAHAAARDAWNERLGVVHDVKGATDAQLETLYSSLYRLNLYPNSQFENVGSADSPEYAYASPVAPTAGDATDTETNAKIVDGKIYVNNGFWDTYRTAWPLYSMLYPDVTDELVDGFVQQYRDSGWIARWSSPGYADLMTGTSSDVAFAEAYLTGALDTSTALDAYDAALKNATVKPESNAVGRKGLERSIFLGFTDKTTHQSVSWGLEGYINDYGISQMAAKLAEDPNTPVERVETLKEEAEYFSARASHYAEMFNPEAGVFTARNADGSWPDGADFDKKAWNEDVTEASAWTFAFHAPFDVDGMAALYGGRQGLVDELHEFLTEREEAAYSGIHEAREARDVRLGMLGMSNQVAHHIPYVLAEAGDPTGAQELIRDIQNRMFVGGDIGQGYPGDEDNGEFSAWYVFSALGFYPLENGSGDYTVGTPLFDGATLSVGGHDIRIEAPGASEGKTYVAGVDIDGTAVTDTTFDGDLLRSGSALTFEMSDEPSSWGAKDLDEELDEPETLVDATKPGRGTLRSADGTATGALVDDSMNSSATFDGGTAELTWTSASGPVSVGQYTLTSASSKTAPSSWTLSGSVDGEHWTELDAREDQEFRWGTQTRPFSVAESGGYTQLKLEISGGDALSLAEVELFAESAGAGDLSVSPADAQRVPVDEEFDGTIATIVGAEGEAADLDVTVDYGDGQDAGDVTLTADDLGGLRVSAPHTFTAPGAYDAAVTVRDASGAVATATARIEAYRDQTQDGAYTNNCIGSVADGIAANCDGQGSGYDRDDLAGDGFVQGETHVLPDTELTYDLPDIPTGEPDNITGEGQTFHLDLGEGATQLAFVGTATEEARNPTATLTFTDGTTQEVEIGFGDWVGAYDDPKFGGQRIAGVENRMAGTGTGSKHAAIYGTAPVALDTDDDGQPKVVSTLTMPKEAGSMSSGRVHVFAIASDGDRAAGDPLEVTAASVDPQVVGEEFEATLATAAGGAEDKSAVTNWGDGTPVDAAEVEDGSVSGTHAYAEAGTYEVTVTVDDGIVSRSATLDIEVTEDEPEYSPEISLDPAEAAPGDEVTVTGSGFAPEEKIALRLGDADAVQATSDADGGLAASVTVPKGASDGTYPVIALGDVSQVEATADLAVRAPSAHPEKTAVTLTADETDVVAGDTVTLTASVDPAEAQGTVTIVSRGDAVGEAHASGPTEFEVEIPTAGTHQFIAKFVPDEPAEFRKSQSKPLKVTAGDAPVLEAHFKASQGSVVQGGTLRVTGNGYEAGETVAITLHSDPVAVAELTADDSGSFRASVTIPSSAPVGDHRLVAEGASSGLSAEVALEVTAAVPDDLAVTGSTIPFGLIAAVVVLLVAGGAILLIARRRRS